MVYSVACQLVHAGLYFVYISRLCRVFWLVFPPTNVPEPNFIHFIIIQQRKPVNCCCRESCKIAYLIIRTTAFLLTHLTN